MNKWTIFASWITMFILSLTPLFLNKESLYTVRDTYTNILYFILASFCILISIMGFIYSQDLGKRNFAIVAGISSLMLLIYQIFEYIYKGAEGPAAINWWFGFWIAAYFPFIVLSVKRIIEEYRFITRASFTIGMGITSLVAVVSVPVFVYFLNSSTLSMAELISFSIILVLDMISFIMFNILLVLYFRIKYGYHWLFMAIGFAILIFRDLAGVYYFMFEDIYPQITITVLNLFFFSTMITALLTFFDKSFSMKPIKDIEAESDFYKSRYEELDFLSKDLITVTELWFHDLKNDINVLENSFLLFEENHKTEFLDIIKKRLELMGERQERFQSPVGILDSLKIQPIDVTIIKGLEKAFSSIKINIPNKPLYVKSNKLLFPIILNVVQNAFQHGGGEDIKVNIEIKDEKDSVLIQIKDNGKGISDENKKKIFDKDYKSSDTNSSGIGLYLVKLASHKFGATINVEDNEPKGTIFSLRFQKMKNVV